MSEDLNSDILNQFNVVRDKTQVSRMSSNSKSNYNINMNMELNLSNHSHSHDNITPVHKDTCSNGSQNKSSLFNK